jgi:hypothetical protein
MRDRIAARREVVVGSFLILVRASLIAIAGGLIVIGPGLVLVVRRLIALPSGSLVGLTCHGVDDEP